MRRVFPLIAERDTKEELTHKEHEGAMIRTNKKKVKNKGAKKKKKNSQSQDPRQSLNIQRHGLLFSFKMRKNLSN